jgi:hypothetical protein
LEQTRKNKKDQRGGFEELFYLEETGVRTLREMGDDGRLPLFTATPSRPGELDPKPKKIELMATESALELVRFRVPLVPPVRLAGQASLIGETSETEITVDYMRDKLVVSLRRPRPKPSNLQLDLFPEWTMELPESGRQ